MILGILSPRVLKEEPEHCQDCQFVWDFYNPVRYIATTLAGFTHFLPLVVGWKKKPIHRDFVSFEEAIFLPTFVVVG